MNADIQSQAARNIGPPQPAVPGTPPPRPQPEIPHESPPAEIPAKPERELPAPEPERARGLSAFGDVGERSPVMRFVPLALAGASLFLLDGCAVIEGIFKAGVGVGALVVIAIVAVIGGGIALITRK